MPREYPQRVSCPKCGEPMPRHCVSNAECGWFVCLAETRMYVLGAKHPVTRKYAVVKSMQWTHLR